MGLEGGTLRGVLKTVLVTVKASAPRLDASVASFPSPSVSRIHRSPMNWYPWVSASGSMTAGVARADGQAPTRQSSFRTLLVLPVLPVLQLDVAMQTTAARTKYIDLPDVGSGCGRFVISSWWIIVRALSWLTIFGVLLSLAPLFPIYRPQKLVYKGYELNLFPYRLKVRVFPRHGLQPICISAPKCFLQPLFGLRYFPQAA